MNQEKYFVTAFNTFGSPEKAASILSEEILDQTKKVIKEKGRCVWAISGGSSILKLYDALSVHSEIIDAFGKSLIVTWVDERVVPHDHPKSNFGKAKNYFWDKFEDVQLLPVPYDSSPNESADTFEKMLEKQNIYSGDVDIMILGMGADGHTASLFPHNEKLKEERKNIVAVSDPSVDVDRVSMTFPFINSSPNIYLFFYGEEKGETIREAIKTGNSDQYPILGINWENLGVYTDQEL